MKAVELRDTFGIDALTVSERPDLKPGPGQVLMQVRACSLNYRDLLVVKGAYNPKLRLPFVPLSDGAGRVAAVGDGVTRVRPGDRVANTFMTQWIDGEPTETKSKSSLGGGGLGMLAEQVVLPEEGIVPMPAHLRDEEAATLPCAALTAWHALVTEGNVKPGETVLVQGTGGVSVFALQFARLAGARVIATSSSDAKLERIRAMGAFLGINYKKVPEWDKPAREATDGIGVDHVIEVGGAVTLGLSLRAVRPGGRVSLIGVLTGGGGTVNPLPILMKNIRVQGIYVGSRAMFEVMNRAIAQHELRPVVDRVFTLREVPEAFRYLESGAHFGKVVIRLGDSE
jgi:NADPH:quinone reductase-like Zn-dependent oxidoreductase